MNLPEVVTLYSASAIEERVRALGRRLEADHEVPDPLVVALVGGSVVFVADLVRAIQRPIRFDSIQVQFSLSGPDDDILEIHYPISLDVSDQILIVITDVSTSGVIDSPLIAAIVTRYP